MGGGEIMEGKIDRKLLEEIANQKDSRVEALFLSEEDFKKLEDPSYDLSGEKEKDKNNLIEIYRTIIDVLKYYVDLDERYYSLISIWIIGTYFHKEFPTYPYLFFNAMKGSGKSRLLRLITYLSKDGCMLNSLTEAVLFRTTGTLGIDEFEGLNRKGKENLSELLNSAYKKGIKVKRMKKVKTFAGEEQQVEEFDVYRPICIANISGMDNVLNDRCITIILNRSNNPLVIKKVELFETDSRIHFIKSFPFEKCSICSVDALFKEYNTYIDNIYTHTLHTYNYTNYTLFNKINEAGIDGRNLEITLSLLILANQVGEEVFDTLLETLKEVVEERKREDSVENLDISLINFISEEIESNKFVSVKDFFLRFKEYVQMEDKWFNERWMGRALKRLGLVIEKKRLNFGMVVIIDYKKAKEKILMFK